MKDLANFGIITTLETIDSSVLFEFEVRPDRDPINAVNFKFSTLGARSGTEANSTKI